MIQQYGIRHLENRHDPSDLDEISQTGAEWHADCEVEFQYGGRSFFQSANSYTSDVDWAITTKFGLLIDIDLLKRGRLSNPKPKVKLRLSVRHLENRYNIKTLPKMVISVPKVYQIYYSSLEMMLNVLNTDPTQGAKRNWCTRRTKNNQ